jgi:hypothetical protein
MKLVINEEKNREVEFKRRGSCRVLTREDGVVEF